MEMPWRRCRWLLASALLVACVLTAQMALGRKKEKSGAMDGQKRALHALNRLTFGPRPGDVDRVAQMGVDRWIDLELHPTESTTRRSTPGWLRSVRWGWTQTRSSRIFRPSS